MTWKELGITVDGAFLCLSSGRGREPLRIKLPARLRGVGIRQVQLVWHRNGYWVHIAVEKPALKKVEGGKKPAAIDPGEIHAVTITDGQEALVISGGFFGLSTACGTRSCVGFSGPYPGRRRDHVGGGSCWMPSTDS